MVAFLRNVLHKSFYFVAGLLILFAVLVIAIRAVTPWLDSHREYFERWSANYFHCPIKVGKIYTDWQGFYPDLTFNDVTILSVDSKQKILHVKELRFTLDVVRSLMSLRLQPKNIKLIGLYLEIRQKSSSAFTINNFINVNIPVSDKEGLLENNKLMSLLPESTWVILDKMKINWIPEGKQPFEFLLDNVRFLHKNNESFLRGEFVVLNNLPTHVYFGAFSKGNLRDLSSLSAQLYLKWRSVMPLTKKIKLKWEGSYLTYNSFNGEAWVDWENKRVQSVHTLLEGKDLQIQNDSEMFQPLYLKQFAGNILWKFTGNGWVLAGDDLSLMTKNELWKKNKLIVQREGVGEKKQYKLFIRYVNIKDAKRLLINVKTLPEKLGKILKQLNVSGELYNLWIKHHGDLKQIDQAELIVGVKGLDLQRWKNIPGVKGLSGVIKVDKKQGRLILRSKNYVQLDFGKLFVKPLELKKLTGGVSWSKDRDGFWVIKAKNLLAMNDQVASVGEGVIKIPADGSRVLLSLLVGFDLNDSKEVKKYIPITILDHEVVDWLNHAFVRGDGGKGTFVFRGDVGKFPFDHNEGVFVVNTKVRDTDLHYAPDWPNAKNISGDLIFSRRSMSFKADKGQIYNGKVKNLNAKIPYMGEDKPVILYLNGVMDCDASDVFRYLRESPLHEELGAGINDIDMHGKTQLDLDLSIPLEKPEQSKVKGAVTFDLAQLKIPKFALFLNKLNGKLHFTEDVVWSDPIKGNLFDSPMTLQLSTKYDLNKKKETHVSLNGSIDIAMLAKHLSWINLLDIKGKTSYQASLNLPIFHKETEAKQNSLILTSNLHGIEINLPSILVKDSKKEMPLNLRLWFGGEAPAKFLCRIKDKVSLEGLFKPLLGKTQELFGMRVHFGSSVTSSSIKEGLYIDGNLETFDWKYWQNRWVSLAKDRKAGGNIGTAFRDFLRTINLKIDKINILDQELLDTLFVINPDNKGWNVKLNSAKVAGSMVVPYEFPKGVLQGKFLRLFLHLPKQFLSEKEKFNPGVIPDLKIHANDFRCDGQQLGTITLDTHSQENTLKIDKLLVSSPIVKGELSGMWMLNKNDYASEFSGTISSDDVSSLLRVLKIMPSLFVDKGKATFKLKWPGVIYKPDFKTTHGNISLQLAKGRIIELGSQADAKLNIGRMLTLLNVNRLLVMDFSDLTQKGYSFDELNGDLTIDDGKLYTNDLIFDGSVARISVTGVINIVKQYLDLKLIVTPYLTSSLPIVATLTGGPIAGAVTWAADRLLRKAVGKITSYYFSVKGDWSKPEIDQIKSI